jgi:hypothetical protein
MIHFFLRVPPDIRVNCLDHHIVNQSSILTVSLLITLIRWCWAMQFYRIVVEKLQYELWLEEL